MQTGEEKQREKRDSVYFKVLLGDSRKRLAEDVRETLVYKLWRDKCWGAGHHGYSNLTRKGFPSHVRGKFVEHVLDSLIKDRIIISRPSGHDYQCFLNREKLAEIDSIIKKYLKRKGIGTL